jgi:hypothetical protein
MTLAKQQVKTRTAFFDRGNLCQVSEQN